MKLQILLGIELHSGMRDEEIDANECTLLVPGWYQCEKGNRRGAEQLAHQGKAIQTGSAVLAGEA